MHSTSCLHYLDSHLYIENVSLHSIAEEFGTPCYIYSRAAIEHNWRAFNQAFDFIQHRVCYAVKANSNIAILNLLAKLGSGFDIVSLGELERVIAAQGEVKKVIFSGVGKRQDEIESAIKYGIYCFDVESQPELERLQSIAQKLNKQVNIALRINPDVDPKTHAYISTGLKENKFGIELEQVLPICKTLSDMPNLHLIGLASHIGSQITELAPFLEAIDCLLGLYEHLKTIGVTLTHLNIGGGLGINYSQENPPSIQQYADALKSKLHHYPLEIILEPGRSIVGNAGVLLTRVEYLKQTQHKHFAIVDAGMNDLLRPALYQAWQHILPVTKRTIQTQRYDITGPVCESADFLGKERELAIALHDLLAIDSAGAYGFSMSSNYNSRCRPAEVLVAGEQVHLIRKRENLAELFASEIIP